MNNKHIRSIQKSMDALTAKQAARVAEIEELEKKREEAEQDAKSAREAQDAAMVDGNAERFHEYREAERAAADRSEMCSRKISMLNKPLLSETEAAEVSEKLRAAVDGAIGDAEKAAAELVKKLRAVIDEAGETVNAYNDASNFIGGNGGTGDTYNRMNSALFDIGITLKQIQARKPKSGVFVK